MPTCGTGAPWALPTAGSHWYRVNATGPFVASTVAARKQAKESATTPGPSSFTRRRLGPATGTRAKPSRGMRRPPVISGPIKASAPKLAEAVDVHWSPRLEDGNHEG